MKRFAPRMPVRVKFVPSDLKNAVQRVLAQLYGGFDSTAQLDRDDIIRQRHAAGEGLSALGREFGISPQRVYQIVSRKDE